MTFHSIYSFFLQSIREVDKAQGGELLKRWLSGPQSEFEALYARIQSLLDLFDVERTPLAALKHLRWLVGFTSAKGAIAGNLGETELRRLVEIAARTWKQKGTDAGLADTFEAISAHEVRVRSWFYFRPVDHEVEFGIADLPAVDLWLTEAEGMPSSIAPASVTSAAGRLIFDATPLLGTREITPREVRVLCRKTKTLVTTRSSWNAGASKNQIVTGLLGQTTPSTSTEDYRIGVDPEEFSSDLRIVDDETLNHSLVENLCRILRGANERIFVRYVHLLDGFRRGLEWTRLSGVVTHDAELGELWLGSTSEETAVRSDLASDAWSTYFAMWRISLEESGWAEARFYFTDASSFYAIRVSPVGLFGATITLDRVLAGVRSSVLTVSRPAFRFGTPFLFTVDAVTTGGSSHIQVFLEGSLLGELDDAGPTAGRLGLACAAGQSLGCSYVELHRTPMTSVRLGPDTCS